MYKREIEKDLLKWKNNENRKPLVLRGARQVGKTFILKEFGKKEYSNVIYINAANDIDFVKATNSLSFDSWVDYIILNFGEISNDTLVIVDEVQVAPKVIQYLKPWNEDSNMINNIVITGSWLQPKLNELNISYPVGQVNLLTLYPLNFKEFLAGEPDGDKYIKLLDLFIETKSEETQKLNEILMKLYSKYVIYGGMPGVLMQLKNSEDDALSEKRMINDSYLNELGKSTDRVTTSKLMGIYESIPSNLSRENNKFKYTTISQSARSRDFSFGIHWMKEAKVVAISSLINKPEYPIKSHEDTSSFKLFGSDVGLVSSLANIVPTAEVSSSFNGWLAENYVANQLTSMGYDLNYWKNGNYEMDFIIEKNGFVIPIDVKNGRKKMSKSMGWYRKKYSPKLSIIISSDPLNWDNGVINIPLYAVNWLDKIIDHLAENE